MKLQGLMFAAPYVIFEASQKGNIVLCFSANTCLSLQSSTDKNLERANKGHCSWPRNSGKKDAPGLGAYVVLEMRW